MSLESGTLLTIEGATLAECKRKLQDKYGDDYEIKNRESIFKSCGLFGLKQKEVQVVTYVINHKRAYDNYSYSDRDRESEEERLEKNRQAILQAQNATMVNTAISTLSTKIDEMNKQINSLNSNINSSTGEVHETIRRIEDLLEQNEFTMSYIRMIEEKIRAQFSLDELDDFNLVERYVVDWIGESIQISQ